MFMMKFTVNEQEKQNQLCHMTITNILFITLSIIYNL